MNTFLKFVSLACFAALPFIGLSHTAHASSEVDMANAYVDEIATKALNILNSDTSKVDQTSALEALIKQHVDINWIGKFVMGKHWRGASEAQRSLYLSHYNDFILQSYASRFTEYKGEGYKLLNSRDEGNNKYTVKMSIDVGGNATSIDYKLRKSGSEFKIYDLNVEGVSLITTQRAEFNSIIRSKGVDYLISQLASKTGSKVANAN